MQRDWSCLCLSPQIPFHCSGRVQMGAACFGTRDPLPCITFWDGAWDLGRQGTRRPECPRLHLSKTQGLSRHSELALSKLSLPSPTAASHTPHISGKSQRGTMSPPQPCHHAEGTRETILAEEERAAGDEGTGLACMPAPARARVCAKVNCKMSRCLNTFMMLVFLLFPRPPT